MSNNVAEVRIVANPSQLPSGLQRAAGFLANFAKNAKNALSGIGMAPQENKKRNWMAVAAGAVVGSYAVRGIDMLVDQGKKVFDFNDKLVRFGIAAKQTPAQLNEIARAARETAAATGIDASVVLDSARAYVDLAGAQNTSIEKMKILARTGQASEATGADLAGMMYQLTRSMKIADDQMEDTMGGLINQAKEGAIEAKQMAAEFSGMMPIFARFGVTGREGATQLGAMYQVTRDGFDSASQAATGMIRLMAGLQRHASRFEAHGIHVFKKGSKKELRELSDIMDQIKKSPLNKDIEALIKSFGRSEAWRTFELIAEAPTRLASLEAAGRANGVVVKDLATYTESAAGRMAIAMEKMKNAIAEAFTPERIEKFVAAFEGITDKIGPLVEGVGKLGDALGALYGTGQAIRGVFQHNVNNNPYRDAFEIAGEDRGVYVSQKMAQGKTVAEALTMLGEDFTAYEKTANDIQSVIGPEGKASNAATKRAVLAVYSSSDAPGSAGAKWAGGRYLDNMKIPQDVIQRVLREARQEIVDKMVESSGRTSSSKSGFEGFESYGGRSVAGMDPVMQKQMTQSFRDALVQVGFTPGKTARVDPARSK